MTDLRSGRPRLYVGEAVPQGRRGAATPTLGQPERLRRRGRAPRTLDLRSGQGPSPPPLPSTPLTSNTVPLASQQPLNFLKKLKMK